MSVTLVNLTPHPLVLVFDDGETRELPRAAEPARVVEMRQGAREVVTQLGRIEIADVTDEATVVGLPPRRDGVVLVVSRVTAAALDRSDVVFPLDEVRDDDGRIVGCRALGRFVST